MNLTEAINIVKRLYDDLETKDPDQEVAGWAIPTLDAGLAAARSHLPSNHPVVLHVAELLSAANAGEVSEPIRAFDLRLQVGMLYEALQAQVPPYVPPPPEPNWWDKEF